MFGLFKKKSEVDILHKKYTKLLSEWHQLSNTNRAASDQKYAEAQKILAQIEQLEKES